MPVVPRKSSVLSWPFRHQRPNDKSNNNNSHHSSAMNINSRSNRLRTNNRSSIHNKIYFSQKLFVYLLIASLFLYIPFTNIKHIIDQTALQQQVEESAAAATSSLSSSYLPQTIETRISTTTTTAATTRQKSHTVTTSYRPWPKRVFVCGWHPDLLASLVFPNVTTRKYGHWASLPFWSNIRAEDDVLVFGMHGPCGFHDASASIINTIGPGFVQSFFPGPALFWNGEPYGDARGHNTYQVGTISKDDDDSRRSLTGFYYMSIVFLELSPTAKDRDRFFDHAKKPKNTGERGGVIYMVSNCNIDFREEAVDRISDIAIDDNNNNLIVHYGGKCRGKREATAQESSSSLLWWRATPSTQQEQQQKSKLVKVPEERERNRFRENWKLFQKYRYCLVMENSNASGYISEKIVLAFLGGCIPIYYGTREVFDIFNKDAFVFYDIDHPDAALEQIRFMETQENRTAYERMLSQPILANGTDTIERYFSIRDDIGGGKLIRRIRELIGYNPNPS